MKDMARAVALLVAVTSGLYLAVVCVIWWPVLGGIGATALVLLAVLSRWAWLRTERGLRRARDPKVGEWD